jgi:hypothetical protein
VRSRAELLARAEAVQAEDVRAVFAGMLATPAAVAIAGRVKKGASERARELFAGLTCRRGWQGHSSTIDSKPPQNMRMPSNGIVFGSIMSFRRGSDITFFVDPVALRARLVDDPREDDGLVVLQLHRLRKRRHLTGLDVVADALPVLERAVLLPDRSGAPRHRDIGIEVAARDGDDESIDIVAHGISLHEQKW